MKVKEKQAEKLVLRPPWQIITSHGLGCRPAATVRASKTAQLELMTEKFAYCQTQLWSIRDKAISCRHYEHV